MIEKSNVEVTIIQYILDKSLEANLITNIHKTARGLYQLTISPNKLLIGGKVDIIVNNILLGTSITEPLTLKFDENLLMIYQSKEEVLNIHYSDPVLLAKIDKMLKTIKKSIMVSKLFLVASLISILAVITVPILFCSDIVTILCIQIFYSVIILTNKISSIKNEQNARN